MGTYGEYLDRQFPSFQELAAERKRQLARISELRHRAVLVFAADLTKGQAPIAMGYPDLLPINDQIQNLQGKALDLILETPGGSGEIAEDIVRALRGRFDDLGVIVPGWAKSAGTIMVMAADEILMDPASALGPIDAQIAWQGKVFSADALLEGFDKIKEEVSKTNTLNRAYIPILQGLSPGELQGAENALKFAKKLVTDWLAQFKFKKWARHSSTGEPVTEAEKRSRAEEIAQQLCDHRRWLTHGRSIKIEDLEAMRLRITDYSKNPALADAIRRYYTLLQMTFATNIYKVFETPTTQIVRFIVPQVTPPPQQTIGAEVAVMGVVCGKCKTTVQVQANLGKRQPLQSGCVPFPPNNKLACPNCANEMDLSEARRQIEAQAKKPVVP